MTRCLKDYILRPCAKRLTIFNLNREPEHARLGLIITVYSKRSIRSLVSTLVQVGESTRRIQELQID
jgi:hypothetical protein